MFQSKKEKFSTVFMWRVQNVKNVKECEEKNKSDSTFFPAFKLS
jgi:hypothetical protein